MITARPNTIVRGSRRKPLDGLEPRCSSGERQKTTITWSFGMALDTSSVQGAYGRNSVWEEQRLFACVLIIRMT
jgi:hypothetical protein